MTKVTVGLKLAGDLVIEAGGRLVTLNGFAKNRLEIAGGHGITQGIDKAFWDSWLQENKDTKLVKGGYIFANESNEKVKKEAEEKKDTASGTEKLKQDDKGIEKADGK